MFLLILVISRRNLRLRAARLHAHTAGEKDRQVCAISTECGEIDIQDARLKVSGENQCAIGIILGTSVGTLCYAEQQISLFYEKGIKRINPFFATSVIPSSAVTQIMLDLKIKGPCRTITTACASSRVTCSVGEALRVIRDGELDVVLAGGAEAPITPLVLAALGSLQLLWIENDSPETAFRPFSKQAAGFVLGEGAGILVLEELQHALRRNATIYAEVVGFGTSSDAYHVMSFDPTFERPVAAVREALRDAKMSLIETLDISIRTESRSRTMIAVKCPCLN